MIISTYHRLKAWLIRETWALPLDIFRILVGILCFFYFISLIPQVTDFSTLDSLINHEFFLEAFWWLNINLIRPEIARPFFFYLILGLSLIGSLGIIIGFRVKLLAFILFLIAASIHRWNFPVMYVDDTIIHLLLFWLLLLPVGKTLVLSDLLKRRDDYIQKCCQIKVPGIAVNCLLLNLCWVYFFAGITKAFSPLWQQGFAFYPILLLPISRIHEYVGPEHLTIIKLNTYVAPIVEMTLPFLLLSPKGSLRKWIGLFSQLIFHLVIIVTLKIPWANIALIAALVLFFREELMEWILRRESIDYDPGQKPKTPMLSSGLAIVFVILIFFSTFRHVPILKKAASPAQSALWMIGVVQHYQLFDWISRYSFKVEQQAVFYPNNSAAAPIYFDEILPRTVRYSVLQLLYYDMRWTLEIPHHLREEFKKDFRQRLGRRTCTKVEEEGRFVLTTTFHHITPDNVDLKEPPTTYTMSFDCFDNKTAKFSEEINKK